jgi:hypothetical protein
LIGEFSTMKEQGENTYSDSLKCNGVKVGPHVDFLLLQAELRSKPIAMSHDCVYGDPEYRGYLLVAPALSDKIGNLRFHRADMYMLKRQIFKEWRTDFGKIPLQDIYIYLVLFSDLAPFQLVNIRKNQFFDIGYNIFA